MSHYIQLAVGMLLLSFCLGYAMWVRVRVWRFRQDLFEIRDHLWDQMRSQGKLNDAAHREARNGINVLIRLAPALSLVSFSILVVSGVKEVDSAIDKNAPTAVNRALHAAVRRTLKLVIFESPLGLLFLACAFVVHIHRAALARIDSCINRLLRSEHFGGVDWSEMSGT